MKSIKLAGSTKFEKYLGVVAAILLLLFIGRSSGLDIHLGAWQELRDELATQEGLYQRYLSVYNQRQRIENIYQKNKQTISTIEQQTFHGKDINVTTAQLQKIAQQFATKNHITIQRTSAAQPVEISLGLYIITVDIFAEAKSMFELNNFLKDMESYNKKMLFSPRMYLKNNASQVSIELKVFAIAMLDKEI